MRWAAGLGALAMLAAVAGLYVALESNPAEAQSPPTGYTLNTVIGAPTELTATVTNDNQSVKLRWTAPQGTTPDGYQISRQEMPHDAPDPEVLNDNTGNQRIYYRDKSITVPGEYTYWVRTVQGTEVSSPVTVVSPHISLEATPPLLPPPTDLTASDSTNNQAVILQWTAPPNITVDGYEISRQKLPYDTVNPEIVAADTGNDATEYRDDSITVAGGYRYWVRAIAGTEVGSPATVVSPYISLLAPPPPSQPDPIPTNHATREAVLDEMYRLEAAVADAAAGCMLYETAHPFSGEEFSTYTTEPAGIQCVALRDLVLNNCVPSSQVSRADRFKYTVGSYAAGQPAFLSSHIGKIWAGEYTYTSVYGQDSNTHDADAVGQWPNDAILKYNSPGRTPNITFEISLIQNELNYETGTTDSDMGSSHDQIVSDLTMLHERLVDITKTESYGQYYLPAANCHFNSDEADTIASADSEITLATTKFGGKDPGEDIDVFYVDMVQNVEYEAHIQGLDPTSQDAQLALAKLVISRESNHSISEIEPQMKVLDADGNELDLLLHGETKSFTPDATARYYFDVQDDAHVREHMSGLYKIVVNIVGESSGDVGQTTTDAQPIQANTEITGSIGTAADADWFSFTIGDLNEAHTIVLDGDVTNRLELTNPAMAIFKPNGSRLDADKQSVRNHDGYIVIELDSLRAGTYYAAVSATNPIETGEYILTHYTEDHPGFVDHSTASVSVDAPVTGNIGGFWDRDRMELVANGAHNYIVEIAGGHGFDASVTLKSDSPNEFPYTFTKRAEGKYVLAFVEGGITGLPRYHAGTLNNGIAMPSEDLPVHFYLDVEANPGLTYGRNEDYVVSIKTGQYNPDSSRVDRFPEDPAGVDYAQVDIADGGTYPIFGYINGNGDKDGFKIVNPGTYIFRTTIGGGVDADAVTGMALRLKNTGSGANWFDVHLRFDERGADGQPIFIAGEFGLVLSQSQVNANSYLQVYNRNADTTVPYTMMIERDNSHVNGHGAN